MRIFIRSSIKILQCANLLSKSIKINKIHIKDEERSKIFKFNNLISSDALIIKKLSCNEIIEDHDWSKMREELLKSFPESVSEINLDAVIYDLCIYFERNDVQINYFKYLEKNNFDINLNIIGRYFRILQKKKSLTPEEEKDVCRIYDGIRKKYPLLDSKTCNDCILVLSLTKRWRESLELLKMVLISNSPGVYVMSSIINAALKHNDIELVWKLINNMPLNLVLDHSVYLEYLNYCKRNFEGTELIKELEKIILFWREKEISPVNFVIQEYAEMYKSFGYCVSYLSISDNGNCSSCNNTLQTTILSKTDFKMLSTGILKNSIIGKDVYQATSPQELKRYMLFLKTMKPYDVVIDGLNVAYYNKNHRGSLQQILDIVNYFYNNKKRVLIIGRAHLTWWSRKTMDVLQKRADIFLTKNMSQDDPFLLHVTLISGPQTYFVSRDFMRPYKDKLKNPDLQRLFKYWQTSRQYMFEKCRITKKMIVIPPIRFEIIAQKFENGWHIPYTDNIHLITSPHQIPKNWVCIVKKKL